MCQRDSLILPLAHGISAWTVAHSCLVGSQAKTVLCVVFLTKHQMRLYEITETDPILSDARMVEVIQHYLGMDVVDLIKDASPYTATSEYKQYKGIYDRIAQAVKPLVQTANPNIDLILKTVNKQLPLVSLPKWVQQRIAQRQQRDREQDRAHREYTPGDRQAGAFTIPDEGRPPPAWKLTAK